MQSTLIGCRPSPNILAGTPSPSHPSPQGEGEGWSPLNLDIENQRADLGVDVSVIYT